ncbi:radical SAM protein [Sphingomonas sp.]|uniref:radical SAM protein n=1 Tax=Sphingomonas sp. TaxID=28214 RepID=UPI003B3A6334
MLQMDEQSSPKLRHIWLEVTGRCNLQCTHCYADSGPTSGHGIMSQQDWLRVIDEADELAASSIQFIGGEPTLHPNFLLLLRHAASKRGAVEVYTNMVSVKDEHWSGYQDLGISLATSFYGSESSTHDAMTKRRGSQSRTLKNIESAVARGIPIRVAIISEDDGDQSESATANLLAQVGVTDISWDRVRGVGRGSGIQPEPQLDALCGNCTAASAAVAPSGDVFPCIFARTASVGNVRQKGLADVLGGSSMRGRIDALRDHFARRPPVMRGQCTPCAPDSCNPNTPPPPCRPLELTKPYDPGRPPDKIPFEKLPLREKIPTKRVPKIKPEHDQPN